MSTPRLNLLDLPTEILSNIVECVHQQGINLDDRIQVADGEFRRIEEALMEQTGREYKYTFGSLYGTCRRFREISTPLRFQELNLRQSMHAECGDILDLHREHVRSVAIDSASVTTDALKHVTALLSQLGTFPNLNEMYLHSEEDWEHLAKVVKNHLSTTPWDPWIRMALGTISDQVRILTADCFVPYEATFCLDLFKQVRHLYCRTLSPHQQTAVAKWRYLKVLDLSYLIDDPVSSETDWEFCPRTVSMRVNRLATEGTIWPYVSEWSRTLEAFELSVESDREPGRLELPESFPNHAFPLLKKLSIDTRTSEVEYLLPLFPSAPLVELVLYMQDGIGEAKGIPMEDLLRPFLPTLRHIHLSRLYQPSLLPECVTPSFLDFCHRHDIAITYRPSTVHVSYYRIFDKEKDDPKEVASISRSDMVKGCEQLMDYQRDWLKRCVDMGDDAGINEVGALLRDTAARFIADRD